MNDRDWNWVAGIFEGEGTVQIQLAHGVKGRPSYHTLYASPKINIGNTDYTMLLELQRLLGVGKIYRAYGATTKWNEFWQYSIWGHTAIITMVQLLPYLRTQYKQNQVAGTLLDWALLRKIDAV